LADGSCVGAWLADTGFPEEKLGLQRNGLMVAWVGLAGRAGTQTFDVKIAPKFLLKCCVGSVIGKKRSFEGF
jgi:hypothetical protein